MHYESQKVGKVKNLDHQICYCCGQGYAKQELSFDFDIEKLQFLGMAYPFHFLFLKWSPLLIVLCFASIFAIRLLDFFCFGKPFLQQIEEQENLTVQGLLSILTVVTLFVGALVVKRKVYNTLQRITRNVSCWSYYTVLLRGLPLGVTTKDIHDFFKSLPKPSGTQENLVERIQLYYHPGKYLKRVAEKLEIIQSIQQCKERLKNPYLEEPFHTETQHLLQELLQRLEIVRQKMAVFERETVNEGSKRFQQVGLYKIYIISASGSENQRESERRIKGSENEKENQQENQQEKARERE